MKKRQAKFKNILVQVKKIHITYQNVQDAAKAVL